MAEWLNGFVEANGLKVFYHRTGAGSHKPPILLLHGFTDNGLCWSEVARQLEGTYDVIMTDARGHGQTEGPVMSIPTSVMADDAAAVIRGLGLDNPFLSGHSMGAMTATATAANYPELVRAAVLEDPPFFNPGRLTSELRQRRQDGNQRRLAFLALSQEERIAQARTQNPGWSDGEIIPWVQAQVEYNPEILQPRQEPNSFVWREAISQVTCPVLLVTADVEKGGLVSPEVAQEATELGASCQVAHISGAGHSIHRDRFNVTMQAVLSFLAKH